MKNLILLLIISYSFTTINFSQTPGYLGKRISIEADVNVLPSFTDFIIEIDNPVIKKNFNTSLFLNYSISRKADIALKVNYSNAKMLLKRYNGSNNDIVLNTVKKQVSYKTLEYSLSFKFYRKNFIAPVGKYISLGLGYCLTSPSSGSLDVNFYYDYWYGHSLYGLTPSGSETYSQKAKLFTYNIGIGDKKVNKNNTYFLYGLELKYYYFLESKPLFASTNNVQDEIHDAFRYNARRNLIYSNLFNLKIGFGVIL